jgi:hypothetical protein
MQDVPAAIAELERVMVQLGFKGAMINDQEWTTYKETMNQK